MAVPQQRNQKKTKGRRHTGNTVARRRFLLDRNTSADQQLDRPFSFDDEPEDFEDWLDEARRPGDWLESEYLEEPTLEDRLLRRPMSFLDRPRSFLDNDNDDYNPDIGNDFDDLYIDESDIW